MKPRRAIGRPRKIIARASIFLLLVTGGAIVNIAVAWAAYALHPLGSAGQAERHCAKLPNMRRGGAYFVSSVHQWGTQFHELGLPVGLSSEVITHYRTLPSWCLLQKSKETTITGDYASGWPCRSVHLIRQGPLGDWGPIEGAITVPSSFGQTIYQRTNDLTLPAIPIWPGIAMNTLFYAAILWLLFSAPLALRRWRRTRRGLCPACAYPVGTSDVCTECGKPIPASLRGRAPGPREGVERTS